MTLQLTSNELDYLNQMVADLYAEYDKELAFKVFLEKIRDLVYFEKGDIYFYRYESGSFIIEDFIFVDWNNNDLNQYINQYSGIDDILPIVATEKPIMFRSSDIFISADRRKTKYYQELICPIGLHHSVEGNIYSDGNGYFGGIGVHRSQSNRDFTLKEVEVLKFARPHLCNIAKDFYKNKRPDYTNIIPLLEDVNDIGFCLWNKKFEIVYSNINKKFALDESIQKELTLKLYNLVINTNTKLDDKKVIRTKISVCNKTFFVEKVPFYFSSTDEWGYKVMIYDFSSIFSGILQEIRTKYLLTSREFEVLNYTIMGLNNLEISEKLFVTLPTIKQHLTSVYRKLGIEGKHQIFNVFINLNEID